ncbi:MAG: selenite/tellurite reduction operon porin ExtI [Phycisphaerales bacterium]
MTQTKHYVFAGVAVGLAAAASAQSLDFDRAYSAELNADAAARTSQLQGGTAGNDGFFYISDGSGNYRLNMSGLIQFRYSANFRDSSALGDNDTTIGFSVPRMQLRWHGNIVNPNWKFMVQADFGESGDLTIQKAYGQYDFEGWDGGFVRFGQFKLPVLAEELIDPEFQLAAERSLTNEYFSQQYSQGVMLGYRNDTFSFHAAFSDGLNTANTAFNSAAENDWALTGRFDVKFEGDWNRFDDFTSWRGDDLAVRVGGAIHWESTGDTNPAAASSTDYLLYTVDAAVEGNGWNLYAAFIGNNADTGSGNDTNDYGAIVQGGIFVTDQLELFGRWDALFLDSANVSGPDDDLHFLTFGANYYVVPQSHAIKATIDTVWSLNQNNPTLSSLGTLPDARLTQILGDTDDGEFVLRGQLSVAF